MILKLEVTSSLQHRTQHGVLLAVMAIAMDYENVVFYRHARPHIDTLAERYGDKSTINRSVALRHAGLEPASENQKCCAPWRREAADRLGIAKPA